MSGELYQVRNNIWSAFVWSANLTSLFQRREMWSGTFGLFIETTHWLPASTPTDIVLAEVPGFAWGILRTIKYKCAIIAHHEKKPEKCQFRPFLWQKDAQFSHGSINKTVGIVSNKEFVVVTTCTPELVSGFGFVYALTKKITGFSLN